MYVYIVDDYPAPRRRELPNSAIASMAQLLVLPPRGGRGDPPADREPVSIVASVSYVRLST